MCKTKSWIVSLIEKFTQAHSHTLKKSYISLIIRNKLITTKRDTTVFNNNNNKSKGRNLDRKTKIYNNTENNRNFR